MVLAIATLLVGATIGLHVEVAEGIADDDLALLTSELARALEHRTGASVALDALPPSLCSDRTTCVAEIQARTRSEDVVFVRVYAAVTRIGLFLERSRGAVGLPPAGLPDGARETRADLPLSVEDWPPVLDRIFGELFPPTPVTPPIDSAPPPAIATAPPAEAVAPEAESSAGAGILPYVTIGSGAALIGVSAVLWASASGSLSDLETDLESRDDQGKVVGLTYDEANSAYDSVNLRRNLAVVAGAAGTTAVVAGVVWLLFGADESAPAVTVLPAGGAAIGWSGRF